MSQPSTESLAKVQAPRSSLFSRQRLSPLERISLGAFIGGTLLNGLVVVILTLALGTPSQDSVTTTVCLLIATILMASGVLLLQTLAVLIGGYVVYALFTEPFVVESLANPKGPNGGYGHFVGDVFACVVVLVAFGAAVVAVIQRFRGASDALPGWIPTARGAVLGVVIGALFIGAIAAPQAAATTTTTTFTNGVPTVHMSAGGFTQPSVTIGKGSQLLLVDDSSALHILANGSWQGRAAKPAREPGAPAITDVSVKGDQVEVGPFESVGTYHIYCVVHPGMELTVIVQ